MSDLHSINEAINKKAGRKLLPSIGVGLSLIGLVWFALSYHREIFAIVVAIAVVLGAREIVRAFSAHSVKISFNGLALATIGLSYAAWNGGVAGLAIATAIAFPLLLIRALLQGPEGFVAKATGTTFALLYLPFLAGFLILLARPSTGFQRVMTFMVLVGCNDTFGYIVGVLFGKHPLVPTISPKKTWEGLAGSTVFTVNGGCLAFKYITDMHWWIGIIVGLMIVFTAT
jgi:phosphatidate cytidylyltransferase